MGSAETKWLDSKAEQICDESHWPEMRALICVVSDDKKDTSSTAGMGTSVATSQLLAHRATAVVPQRMADMVKACKEKDFDSFAKITMQDSNQFHATCLDTYPPIFYMNDVSRSIIRVVTIFNKDKIRAAYTFDAGPNAVMYVLEKDVVELTALLLRYYPKFGQNYLNDAELLKKAQASRNWWQLVTRAVPTRRPVMSRTCTLPSRDPDRSFWTNGRQIWTQRRVSTSTRRPKSKSLVK
jgi:hypothetical protein